MCDSDNESDCSISTQELNDLNSKLDEEIKKKETPKPVEEKIEVEIKETPKKVVKEPEPLKEPEPEPLKEPVVKKKKAGRPPKPIEEKLAKQVITKEKIIYVIQDENGNMVKKDPKKISVKEMKKIKLEEEAQKKELELGKKLGRLKNGKAKIPKERTEKQIAHTKRLMELNKERRGQKKVEKTETTKKIVKEALVEVVKQPMPKKVEPPPKTVESRYNDFFS